MEHIRRQFALLQQQSLLSTDQVGQQLSWMRQQMGSLAMQIGSQGQDQADHDTTWELDTLQVRAHFVAWHKKKCAGKSLSSQISGACLCE